MGWHLRDSDIPLLVCTERRGARGRLLFHKKRGRSPSCGNVILASPVCALVLPPMQRILVRMERFLYCISKLSA